MQSILRFIRDNKWIVIFTLLAPALVNAWLYQDYEQKLQSQRKINDYLITEIENARNWLFPIKDIDRLKGSLLARMEISRQLTQAYSYRYDLYAFLANVPEGITFQKIVTGDAGATIIGSSSSTVLLQQFIKSLNESSLCDRNIQPNPGITPGSFEFVCDHGNDYG